MKTNHSTERVSLRSLPAGSVKLAVFFLVLVLNLLTAKTSDDLGYSISSGLFDILRREYIQYMTWTGRTVAHLIARTFLAMPKIIFDVCNSVIFCVLTDLICAHAQGPSQKRSGILYALCALALFLFAPVFGQTVLWETGSCNYLWTTAIILAFLYAYRRETEERTVHKPWFPAVFLFCGLAAGWTNENTGGACILMVLLYLLVYRIRKIPLKPWMITGLIGALIGFALMIKAPGNAVRAADFVNEGGRAYVFVHDLRNTLNIFSKAEAQLPLWVCIGTLAALKIRKGMRGDEMILSLGYAFCGMAAVCAIILSPVPVEFDRSMFGATVFVIIGAASLLAPHVQNPSRWTVGLLGALCVVGMFRYGHALLDLSYTRYQYEVREKWVRTQKSAGNRNPVIPVINSEFFTPYNAMYGLNDILEYPSFVNNENYALTHGLESVVSTSLEKWNALYRNGDPSLMNILDLETYLRTVTADGRYTAYVTTAHLDGDYRPYLEILEKVSGTELGSHSAYILELGETADVNTAEEPFGKEYAPDGHYVWVYSSDDPMTGDILIDGTEYTNDQEGISVVVFDREQGRAVDSVTWNRDYGTRGIRSYTEK